MAEESQNGREGRNLGTIVEIKGVVIDARFPDRLPGIYNALEIPRPGGAP